MVPFDKGRCRDTHAVAISNAYWANSLTTILEHIPLLKGITIDLSDTPNSGSVALALAEAASASTHRNHADGVLVLDGADDSGLRKHMVFQGNKNSNIAIG